MDGITKETFIGMDTDSKLNVLFDYALHTCDTAQLAHDFAEKLDKRISKGHRVDMFFAGCMGFIGGLVGFFSRSILAK